MLALDDFDDAGLSLLLFKGQEVRFENMIEQRNSYRYYCYYGPLSAGRDGRAMGCRGAGL